MANGDPQGRFWYVNIGHFINLLAVLGAAFAFFLAYDHQIRDNTNGLEAFIRTQIEINRAISDRMKSVEGVAGKLERIDEKLNWIQDWIKEQKQSRQSERP